MPRKIYTDAQKEEILKKAEETSIAEASKEFGVAWSTISSWKAAVTAEKIETNKTVRSSARKAKAKVAEKKEAAAQKKAEIKEVKDAVAAEVKETKVATETKKKTRAAGRKVKETITEKVDNKILADQMAVGRVKATRTRKASQKTTAKAEKAAVKAEDKAEKAAKKPAAKRKARKINILFQSVSGGTITPEEVALKVPQDAVDVYVKLEENRIYWVGKNDEKGSIDIW